MANQWFYARDGQKYGPISSKRLKELATIGVVRRNDLIWSPGYSVWRPAKKFRGLLPKMDATSLSPAMSLFWRPDEAENQNDDRFKGLLLEPNSPATAVTPPLPGGYAKKPAGSAPAGGPVSTNGGGRSASAPAARPATKRPSAAALAEPASAPTSSAAVARPSVQASPKRPEPTVTTVTKTKGKWGGLSSKEKLAIGGGVLVLLLIYGVLLLRVL